MAEMNFWEKFMVNSLFYNSFYIPLWVRPFLDGCDAKGKCLEIGCGPGFTTSAILDRFDVELTTLDYDPEEVEKAKSLFRKRETGNRERRDVPGAIAFDDSNAVRREPPFSAAHGSSLPSGIRKPVIIQADARKLPFPDSSFDTVIEMNTFHHIENYEKAVAEAYRVLKKGGKFHIMDISRYFGWPVLEWTGHFDGKFTEKDMAETLRKSGFRLIKSKGRFLFVIHAVKD
jgi:SAM-dependent methyltransferase